MKTDIASIYNCELKKLHDEGWEPSEEEREHGWTIEDEAAGLADSIYWSQVDLGRQRAKDREIDRR